MVDNILDKLTTRQWTGLAVVISFIALILSVLFSGVFSHFAFDVSVTGIMLPRFGSDQIVDSLPVVLPVTFTNVGIKSGVIEDIVLLIEEKEGGGRTYYIPSFEIDLVDYLRDLNSGLGVSNINSVGFSPFVISPGESKFKTLFFQKYVGKNDTSFSVFDGNYIMHVLIKYSPDGNYVEKFNFPFMITKNTLISYSNGTGQFIYLPRNELGLD